MLYTGRFEEIEKILSGPETKAIVAYIKNNPGTTTDKVVKNLRDEYVCSRLTTIKRIDRLINLGIIKDRRRGKYFHSLYINELFDFRSIGNHFLTNSLDEVRKLYDRYSKDYKHNEMFDKIKSIINEYEHEISATNFAADDLISGKIREHERVKSIIKELKGKESKGKIKPKS